jgi:hypothetical protein
MTPNARTTDRTIEWARIGAGLRLREIETERTAILKKFPELKHARIALPGSNAGLRKLSPAARRKLSAGMRKYWARRKAEAARKS